MRHYHELRCKRKDTAFSLNITTLYEQYNRMEFKTISRPWGLWILLPLYKLIKRLFPKSTEPSGNPAITAHASAMLSRGNWLYRLIFPRFFVKIRYQLPADVDLVTYAEEGTLVYIGTRIRELEYNYFSHLFKQIGLPRSYYANGFSLRRYMVWSDLRDTLFTQLESMRQYGGIPHPASSGELCNMIESGKSILFSLASTELQEKTLLFSESHQLILAAIRAQSKTNRPIYLLPLNFIWDRRPQKYGRSIIDILFGEKDNPGTLRKWILFWRNYKRRAVVQVGNPIDLKAYFIELPQATEEELAQHIRKRILDLIQAERRSITGPPARTQRWFIEKVLSDQTFEKKISRIAVEKSSSVEQLTSLAKRYVREIAAKTNYKLAELVNRPLGWVFTNLFEGFSIDETNLGRIKDLSAYTTLIFVPNHRSHIDYLLLSYIFYNNNMTLPHIAAGINLSFWPLGPLFRRLGAFFIRRTFHGNPVYRDTLQTYLSVLLSEGYNQEFFIEGGRSRTGKLLPPKLGMLSMLADSVIEGAVEDLIFVPVAITYDRVMEHRSYTSELAGATKKSESRRDVLSLAKFFRKQRQRNGLIYVRFGMPVSLSGAAHDTGIAFPPTQENKPEAVRTLADQICREINRNTVITPFALAAIALLLKPKRAVMVNDLEQRVSMYLDYIAPKTIDVSDSLRRDPKQALRDALLHMADMKMIGFHDDPEFPFYEVYEDKRIELDYYKNSGLHYFAALAFLCTVLKKNMTSERACKMSEITGDLEFLQNLFQFEFRFNQQIPIEERVKPPLVFLEKKGALKLDDKGNINFTTRATEILDIFADLVSNVFDSYRMAMMVLKRNADRPRERRELVKHMLKLGPSLFLMGYMSRREAVSKENFMHAMDAFAELGVIVMEAGADKKSTKITVNANRVEDLQAKLERIIQSS